MKNGFSPEVTAPSRRRVTIRMVAERAGVSHASVYAVLNRDKQSNIGVGEETRKAIESAIVELGYIPNNSARMLVSGRSNNIGILLNTVEVQFSRMLGKVLSERCMQNGLMPFVEYYNFEPELERLKLEMFFSRGIDALLVIASGRSNLDLFEKFTRCGIPVVLYGGDSLEVPGALHVGITERAIAAEMSGFLVRNRIERAAYLGFAGATYPIELRAAEMAAAFDASGIKLAAAAAVGDFAGVETFVSSLFSCPAGERPQILVAFTDELANVAVNAVIRSGHTLAELPVVGVDGLERPFDTVPLTSVELPFREIVDALWRAFAAGLRGEVLPPGNHRPRILLRQSTPGFLN